jgi:hypothetical protein
MAQLEQNVDDAEPGPRKWSKNILFGTPAPNQRLYLIHELLDEVEQATGTISQVRNLANVLAGSNIIIVLTGVVQR